MKKSLLTLIAIPSAVLHAQLDPGKTILSYLFLPSRNFEGRVEPRLPFATERPEPRVWAALPKDCP